MKRRTGQRSPLIGSNSINRRDLLKAIGLVGSAMALQGPLQLLQAADTVHEGVSTPQVSDQISRRPLGSTGVEVSILALGGAHLGKAGSARDATRIVHDAIDSGLTLMDNSWKFKEGRM
jgi:hypothetical protein